ncbi:hypothetical protein IGJ66_000476 [Enterococcus sp. DIV0176]|uniref:ApeA N-terminal domain 1-containing protein n=1 Tax=Enterococcus sp. DIV0176 TaxID=2774758 RepID=UPI003D2FB947
MVKEKNPTMFDSFMIEGLWSTSVDFEKTMGGTLKYDPLDSTAIELNLINSSMFEFEEISVLYGISSNDEYVTLIGCRINSFTCNSITTQTVIAQKIIVGKKHLLLSDLKKIKTASFSFFNLNEWMDMPLWNQIESSKAKIPIQNEKVLPNTYRIENIKANLEEVYSINTNRIYKNWNLKTEQYYKLIFDEPKNLGEIYYEVYRIVQFFYFVFSQNAPFKFFEFEYGETIYMTDKKAPDKYRLYVNQISKMPERITASSKMIPYSYISKNLESLLVNWFDNYSKVKPVIQTFVGDLQVGSFIETKFLNACRNIEVFHRVFIEEKKEIPEDIEDIRVELLDLLSSKEPIIKQYFGKRINHTEEGTLSMRIKESINKLPSDFLGEIIKFENKNLSDSKTKFTRACVNTRNYLTHGSSNKEMYKPMFEKENLSKATKVLDLIIEYFILQEIGVETELILDEFRLSKRYYGILNQKFVS